MSFSINGVGGPVNGHNETDPDGNPAGGYTQGTGFRINWQGGPVNRDAGEEPTGAFPEDVIMACLCRLRFFQGESYLSNVLIMPGHEHHQLPDQSHDSDGRFACEDNKQAIEHLLAGLGFLMARRADREERGVLGKHEA